MKLVLHQSQSEVSRSDLSEYGELEVRKQRVGETQRYLNLYMTIKLLG